MSGCEENLCQQFALAVCLHCMHRLCIHHINDHQNIALNQLDQLKTEANQITTSLVNASNTIVEERKADEKKCVAWRMQKLAEINDEYNKMMNSIRIRQKVLEQQELNFNQRLKKDVQEPLEQMYTQKSISPQLLDAIQLTIENIRKDSDVLIWNSPELNNIQNLHINSKDETKSTSTTRSKKEKIKAWKPRELFFTFFRDVGPGSVKKINDFVRTMLEGEDKMENQGLITLVFSYLQTWHKTNRDKHKQLILDKHILTIKQYVNGKDSERKVLTALKYFFNTLKNKDSTEIVEMMTMLLQLFLDHQCISISEMIVWYSDNNSTNEISWVEPFLKLHEYPIEHTTSEFDSHSVSTSNSSEVSSTKTIKNIRIKKPYKRLVQLFKEPQSDLNTTTIHEYIQMQYKHNKHRVIMIVRSYLKAWDEHFANTKADILLSKVAIIKYYQNDFDFQMQIIFAIEVFISEKKKNENWSTETISRLFQFFLDENCITKETILKWNSEGHLYDQDYYEQIKHFAQPFIQRLIMKN
ncbi:unnamed protein product [Adineta steineri]|uniref:W2 domain-containing protein n=1 Tax=Adineta steineri TaxID=433720 RepID=A0A815DF86_9BILA|nr:unnamed protein product [Adineta steineri]CAF3797281.1 unnamed protein product [Adineta steineri]